MEYTLSYQFDRAFIRDVLKRDYFWRVGIGIAVVVLAAIAVQLIYGLPTEVLVGVAGGIAIVIGLVPLRFRRQVDNAHALWRRQSPGGTIRYRFDEEGIETLMEQGSIRYAWRDLRRLWRYRDVWALEVVRNFSVPIPPAAAPPELLEFIVERCRSAGVRV